MIEIEKLHTTPLGEERIRRNLGISNGDIIELCRKWILDEAVNITRQGKNWYVETDGIRLTVNAHSHTIITAHRI